MPDKKKLKRVYQLAKALKVPSAAVVQIIQELGTGKGHASATVLPEDEKLVRKTLKSEIYKNGNGKNGEPKKSGRPAWKPAQRDLIAVERMAAIGMTQEDMATILGICRVTLNRRLQDKESEIFEHYARGRAKGKYEIFNTAHNLATSKENVTMNIWLQRAVYGRKADEGQELDAQEKARKVREALDRMELPEPE